MALSIGFGNSVALLPAIQATRLLTFASVGLSPTEHTCFSWSRFRTAGFPQHGFKAGFSDAAFPADWFAIVLRALRCHRVSPALCQGRCAYKHLRASGPPRSTPGALAPVRVILSRSIITYAAPSAPLAGTSRLHRLAPYTRCLRCAYLHMPRRPTTGSELSLMVFRNMSSSVTTGNFSAAYTQYFTENAGLQLQLTVSAFALSSNSDSNEGDCFRGLTTVRLRYERESTASFSAAETAK
jgi:hypothetical protein